MVRRNGRSETQRSRQTWFLLRRPFCNGRKIIRDTDHGTQRHHACIGRFLKEYADPGDFLQRSWAGSLSYVARLIKRSFSEPDCWLPGCYRLPMLAQSLRFQGQHDSGVFCYPFSGFCKMGASRAMNVAVVGRTTAATPRL